MKKQRSKGAKSDDLPNTSRDEEKLSPDETTMNLPDVRDIPGQEHIRPPKLRSFNDTTISSDDEEGIGIPGLHDDQEMSDSTNVTEEEKDLLEQSVNSMSGPDDLDQRKAMLDDRDEEGELLNEGEDVSGKDLDVPGAEEDDENEDVGEEDEENNSYSLGGDRD
jgi:hypothetical protein